MDLTGKRVAVIGSGATAMQTGPGNCQGGERGAGVPAHATVDLIPTENYRASVPDGEHWLINHMPYYARWYHFLLFWLDGEGLYDSATKDPAWPQNGTVGERRPTKSITRAL